MLKLYSPYLAGFFLFLVLALVSCSEEERIKLIEDNFTDSQPISGVAVAEQDKGIEEGNNLFLQGNFEQAIAKYEEGLKINRSVAFYNMGVSYYLLDDIDKSEEYFRRAIEEDPKFTEGYINLAVVLLQTGKLDEAELYMAELLKDRASGKLLVNMANIYLRKGETARATVLYEEALKKDGKSRFVKSNYAYFLLSIGEFDTGIKIIEGLDYKTYTDYFNLGTAYHRKADYLTSVSNLLLAEKFKPAEEVYELLARNYNMLKSYAEEASVLKKLTDTNNDRDYRHRYATALFKSGSLNTAHEVMTGLLAEYPQETAYYITDYNILQALGEYRKAGELILAGFRAINNDALMYMYAKHSLVYENKGEEVRRLVFSRASSPYVSLAGAMYHIFSGNMLPAQKMLDNVPPETDNDYYVYRAYIMMKYRSYGDALKVAELIDDFKPEYFWYKTVNLWNMKKLTELKVHLNDALTRDLRISRHPEIAIHLDPVLDDMNFSYRFNGEFEDILSSVLYPLLIEPDEMLNFVALGYKLLQQNDRLMALEELQKSVKFSEGIAHNNKGVTLFLAYAYQDAMREFRQANELLGDNPYTLYNIGLVNLAMGRADLAVKFFDNAIVQNRYNFPAYLGKAVCLQMEGNENGAYQEYNLVRDRAEDVRDDREKVPNIIYYTKYLADMGVGDYRGVIEDIGKKKPEDGFLRALLSLSEYLSGQGADRLEPLKSDRIFRGASLSDLLAIMEDRQPVQKEDMITDRFYKFMRSYLQVKKFKQLTGINGDEYINDNVILKELFYYQVYMGDSKRALYYLQRLNNLDFRYPELYKASLYYFIWLEDFVNAEASFSALENLGFQDRYFDYYKMLYFLLNYHDQRLMKQINSYMGKYPDDFRGAAIRLMVALKNDNIRMVYNEMGELESRSGNFLLKLPLELEIDGL
ncbi:MAG: tetratricopeptide repeat protein [Deferribacterales bacterium]